MSIESARSFLTRVAKDESFRSRLGSCKSRADQQLLAKGAGFDFTNDEIKSARSELQDSDLDAISGAACCGYTCESEPQPCGYDCP